MARVAEYFHYGSLGGAIYTFENAGDTLPTHNHTEENAHITIVTGGSIRVRFPGAEDMILMAGALQDFAIGQPHEFEALEPNTKIVNVIKKAQA